MKQRVYEIVAGRRQSRVLYVKFNFAVCLNKGIVLTSSKSKMSINCPTIRLESTDLTFSERQK